MPQHVEIQQQPSSELTVTAKEHEAWPGIRPPSYTPFLEEL